jgi:hypothetical protein
MSKTMTLKTSSELLNFARSLMSKYRFEQRQLKSDYFQIEPSNHFGVDIVPGGVNKDKWFLSANAGRREFIEFLEHPLVNGIVLKTNRQNQRLTADFVEGFDECFVYLVGRESLPLLLREICFPPSYFLAEKAIVFLRDSVDFEFGGSGFWEMYRDGDLVDFFLMRPLHSHDGVTFLKGQEQSESRVFSNDEELMPFLESELESWLVSNPPLKGMGL